MTNQYACKVDGCGRGVSAKGWCTKHYQAHRRANLPADYKPAPPGTYGPAPTHPATRFLSLVQKSAGCWEWKGHRLANGYGQFYVRRGVTGYAHRESYRLHVGEIPDGLDVCHRCDNRGCVNPDHLFLGTRKENMRDCKDKGRTRRRLSPEQVATVKSEVPKGTSQSELARRFGVTLSAINHIVKGRNYAED